jgi:hypothetical protein
MKHKTTKAERKNYLACVFNKLGAKDQTYMETLTAQLAEIQKTAPEGQSICGKNPKNRLQQSMEQDK